MSYGFSWTRDVNKPSVEIRQLLEEVDWFSKGLNN